jgi:hypothetical protein
LPEMKKYCAKVPFLIVGCKTDLRFDQELIRNLQAKNIDLVTEYEVIICLSILRFICLTDCLSIGLSISRCFCLSVCMDAKAYSRKASIRHEIFPFLARKVPSGVVTS